MDAKIEQEIMTGLQANSSVGMSREALLELQERTRAERKCGSLQTRYGLPCRRTCAPGFTVCNFHGSRAPQTIAKAERMLAVLRVPAIENLQIMIDQYQEPTCPACGFPKHDIESMRTQLAAIKLLLDRTGLGPKATLQINATKTDDTDQLIEHMTPEERIEVSGLVQRLDEVKAAVRLRLTRTAAGVAAPAALDAEFTSEPAR